MNVDPNPGPSVVQEDILSAWQERIFFAIFLSTALITSVPYISSLIEGFHEKRWVNLVVYTLGYLIVILIVWVRRIPFPLRVILGIGVFYLLGLTALLTIGPVSSGRIWLFSFSIIASLLLGLRAGVITLAINLCTLFLVGYLVGQGRLEWATALSMKLWIITSITFISLNAMITISLAVLVQALEQHLLQAQKLTQELKATNDRLEQDTRKRRLAEEALIQSEKKLAQAIQGNSIPFFMIDHNHIITHWNRACENLTGFSEAEMKGTRKHRHIFYAEERPMLADFLADGAGEQEIKEYYGEKVSRSILIQGAFEGEDFLPHFGQKGKWLYFTSAPMKDPEGNIMGALETIQDITDRKATEAQLRQAQKMESVGRLAGGVAHDYNNALSVIIGFTELAMGELDATDPRNEDLQQVLRAAARAADITRQLLAFARKQTISPRVLDLNQNVESMLKMLRRLIGEDIDLVWVPGTGLGNVEIDPSQLDQILANLCVNARDALAGVGRITIETARAAFDSAHCAEYPQFFPGEFVMMSIKDNGCGMDKETLDHIFEPFFTTKDVDKGTGLGLSTVYGIVDQNKGFLQVSSEPGKGTTIQIYLPEHRDSPDEIQGENTEAAPQGKGETALVVEDDISILKFVARILHSLNYRVLTADSPVKALALAREHPGKIHLLITDVIMPEMNGQELAEQLTSLYPCLKTLFMSGYPANVIAPHGVLDPGVHFIHKPFSKQSLAKSIGKALGKTI